jgi:signal transduction histidine kinase
VARGERGEHEDERAGYRGGTFYLTLAPDGRVLANPQQVRATGVTFPSATTRTGAYATVMLDGEPARVHARPLRGRVAPGATLIVGQSLAPEHAALRSLLLVLIGGGGLGLLLSFAGAWFLAGRALVPIQHAFARQQEFVADASHELRTPLTVLHSATDLLNQHRAEPLAANGALFDDIRHEIGRLERLAGDLLTLARSDRGELELAVAPLDLGALAADVVRRTDPLAQAAAVRLQFQAEASPPVEADPDRLQQVLLILLDNAIKHTPPGGSVQVSVRPHPGGVLLEVADTGAGIAPEHLPRIFDRFYRADVARSRPQGGTGLGLAIAKMLVEAHGGQLALESAPGAGTRARVGLPLTGRGQPLGVRLGALAARLAHAPARE